MYDEDQIAFGGKLPIYLIPGMAASSKIFEYLEFPELRFTLHYLEWEVPEAGVNLREYARIWAEPIPKGAVLIGVSLGGILAQEMARFCQPSKVIIISSIKSKEELPPKMLFARYTRAHRLLPTQLVNRLDLIAKLAFGQAIHKRLELYKKYIGLADPEHIDWGIDQLVNWDREQADPEVIHIHGTRDAVFPIQYIKDCIPVEEATHTLVIHRAKWLNERLIDLILTV